ncbi:NAD-dependent epimerase/dehydratase family protein [Gordonia insulae]|uniref:UDP-glucose 4-epimerase n=1 Tax=Gordonia insulae TaxID=2420509 RepID=A0A3G8JKD9_9ACTN|nr:NAD-dependent epimerase/dehydratase family protein [Gordonia insulae]AZG44959.1 UDP-glucose 4-epimerase [Gordonia insulae]
MSELVLVTGGSGFLGGWTVAELVRRGRRVRTTLRDPGKRADVVDAAGRLGGSTDLLEFATADLCTDDGWASAMAGVDLVLHIASPSGAELSSDPTRVGAVVDGTTRVLEAATVAGVRRVVVTSAANAANPASFDDNIVSDESQWSAVEFEDDVIPVRFAKTIAERSAWEFVDAPDAPELATILPGAVLGPLLTPSALGSAGIIARMLEGRAPRSPNIGVEVVDVRDLVDLHLRALDHPAAAGRRFLGTGEFLWMRDIARMLRADLGDQAAKVGTGGIPDRLVRLAARRSPELRRIVPILGRTNRHSADRAREVLGWRPRPARQTVLDCARSLVEHSVV